MTILLSHIQILADIQLDVSSVLMVITVSIAFVIAWAVNRISLLHIRKDVDKIKETSVIMQHTLDMGQNYVLKLDIRHRHAINLHGNLLPEGGMDYNDSVELVHPDDCHIYREFIKRLATGETENDESTFRWDISGSLHHGLWRYMECQGVAEYANASIRPIHIFCTMTDRTEKILQEKEEQEFLPLRHCRDAFKKIIVTGGSERMWQDEKGIIHVGVIPFLLDESSVDGVCLIQLL